MISNTWIQTLYTRRACTLAVLFTFWCWVTYHQNRWVAESKTYFRKTKL